MGRPKRRKTFAVDTREIVENEVIRKLQPPPYQNNPRERPDHTFKGLSVSVDQSQTREISSDCYDLLVSGVIISPHFYQSSLWNSMPPSSWLSSDYSFSHSDSSSLATYNKLDISSHSLEEQIVQSQNELNEIKMQLGPATIQYSESLNAHFGARRGVKRKSSHDVFGQVRAHCNPFERVGQQLLLHWKHTSSIARKRFVCRSALKLANINALLNFRLIPGATQTKGPFVFVDLCGAPGGFTEYILYRLAYIHKRLDPTLCQGFGMSLQGSNNDGEGVPWNLDHITTIHPGVRHCFQIVNGSDGTGDIYNWKNIVFLRQFILNSITGSDTPRDGEIDPRLSDGLVDLVVADGGFEAQRDSEYQEDLTCKLVLNQVVAGLHLLKLGGCLCVKMFGFQTTMSQTILEMLCQCFEHITILKPIASRPASAERYVIGIGRNPRVVLTVDKCENIFQSGFHGNLSKSLVPCCEFKTFLLSFERDLLVLNTKACKHILSVLKADTVMSDGCDNSNEMKIYKKFWFL